MRWQETTNITVRTKTGKKIYSCDGSPTCTWVQGLNRSAVTKITSKNRNLSEHTNLNSANTAIVLLPKLNKGIKPICKLVKKTVISVFNIFTLELLQSHIQISLLRNPHQVSPEKRKRFFNKNKDPKNG